MSSLRAAPITAVDTPDSSHDAVPLASLPRLPESRGLQHVAHALAGLLGLVLAGRVGVAGVSNDRSGHEWIVATAHSFGRG
jgi:hypothetical protein